MCCYLPQDISINGFPYGFLDQSETYGAGSILEYFPATYGPQYLEFDKTPKKACCVDSNNCDVFYGHRPSDNCEGYLTQSQGMQIYRYDDLG